MKYRTASWIICFIVGTSEATTEGTTEGTTSGPTTTSKPDGGDSCPQKNPDQQLYVCPSAFRKDPKDCNQFYQCTEKDGSNDLTITKFTCPKDTSYDEKQCKCVKSDSCKSDNTRSLKYLIDPRFTVIRENVTMHASTNKTLIFERHFSFCICLWNETRFNLPFRLWYRMTHYAHHLDIIHLSMMNVDQRSSNALAEQMATWRVPCTSAPKAMSIGKLANDANVRINCQNVKKQSYFIPTTSQLNGSIWAKHENWEYNFVNSNVKQSCTIFAAKKGKSKRNTTAVLVNCNLMNGHKQNELI